MRALVLGPATVRRDDGVDVDLGPRKQRALLAALALHDGLPVSPAGLLELLWDGDAPPGALATLQTYVAGLRRALEPDRPARHASTVLPSSDAGYALRLPTDAAEFRAQVGRWHRVLTGGADSAPATGGAVLGPPPGLDREALVEAEQALGALLDTWRGTPFIELDGWAADAERTRFEELRVVALEDRALARLGLGQHVTVAAELEALAAEHPMRERLQGLAALAIAWSGRQADALALLRQVRATLADELGLDPGPGLQAVEQAVLRQDLPTAAARPPAPSPVEAPAAVRPARHGLSSGAPFVGRDAELAELRGVLDDALAGGVAAALVVGEAGIGKSRLLEELRTLAEQDGAAVAVGRCADGGGAPALWPWQAVAAAIGPDVTAALDEEDGVGHDRSSDDAAAAEFARFERVRAALERAVAGRPHLVIIEDIQRADGPSARLLRHLADTLPPRLGAGLAIVVSRRTEVPDGDLASATGAIARRGAVRLDLSGLDAEAVGRLLHAISGTEPAAEVVDRLRHRTTGNPLFLVELARWARSQPDVDLTADVPGEIVELVVRRVSDLPPASQELLRTAAVVGERVDLALLAAASGLDAEPLLDALDSPLDVGLLLEGAGAGELRFSHGLVRDAVLAATPAHRRARRHADVARALDAGAGSLPPRSRRAAAAHHWLAAGPSAADRAWRAAADAAQDASAAHAHAEAARLLASAADAVQSDPGAPRLTRFELLHARATACRLAGDREQVLVAAREAIDEAEEIGDVALVARAAICSTDGEVWTVRGYGEVDGTTVAALRRSLRELPAEDSDLRCRARLSLAAELYFAPSDQEKDALVEAGMAEARRSGRDELLAWAACTSVIALWRPALARRRLDLAEEAVAAATSSGDAAALLRALTLRATARIETGDVPGCLADVEEGLALAVPRHLPFAELVLQLMRLPFWAMQGRFDEVEEVGRRCLEIVDRVPVASLGDPRLGVLLPLRIWQGRAAELLPRLTVPEDVVVRQLCLARAEDAEGLRAEHAAHGLVLPPRDDWNATFTRAVAAEVALLLDLRDDAPAVHEGLLPLSGGVVVAGTGAALGPVDAFLALAAAAAGEKRAAGRYADAALDQCDRWQMPLVSDWLDRRRSAYDF